MSSLRYLGLLVLVAIGAHGQAQAPPTISFTERGAPLAKVMPRLAEVAKLHLAVTVALRKEVVCIDVHDVTVKALMDRLAQVTAGAWTEAKDGTIYLGPLPSARAAQRVADVAYRTEQLAKALAFVPPKQKQKDGQDNEEEPSVPPALAGLLRGIGVKTLAAIPNGTRVVFSTRPTATQEPLGGQAFEVFAQIARESNAEVDESTEQTKAGLLTEEQRNDLEVLRGRITNAPVKLLLIVGRDDSMSEPVQLHVELRGYDSQGKALQVCTALLSLPEIAAETDVHEERINISHETRQLAQLQRALRITVTEADPSDERLQTNPNNVRFQMAPSLRAEATERVFAPDRFDPLAYGDDYLMALAASKQCQLVACVPDTLLYLHQQAGDAATTPAKVLFRLQQDSSIAVTLAAGWLCIAPRDSDAVEARRVDRADLARVMRKLQTNGYLKLDEVLEMSAANMALDSEGVTFEWCEMASAWFFPAFGEDWPTVALFSSLDEAQRSALLQSHQLGFKYLTDAQASLVRHMIYRTEEDFFISLEHETPAAPAPIGANPVQTGSASDEPDDYRSEPTEIAPNGLPREGYITLSDSMDQVVCAVQGVNNPSHWGYSIPLRVPSFAGRVARTLVPGLGAEHHV